MISFRGWIFLLSASGSLFCCAGALGVKNSGGVGLLLLILLACNIVAHCYGPKHRQ